MSWGLTTPCWKCEKNQECKDAQHIQEGINAIHQDTDGHKGSGAVVMSCSNCVSKN
jgi:hypothetical protein